MTECSVTTSLPSPSPWLGTELLDLEAFECFNSAELSGLALQYDICTMHMYGSTALPATTASTCPLPAALAAAVSGDRLAALEAKREYQRAVQVGVHIYAAGRTGKFSCWCNAGRRCSHICRAPAHTQLLRWTPAVCCIRRTWCLAA